MISWKLKAFVDVDWAENPSNQQSHRGHLVFFGGNLVSWYSKKQPLVARSSMKTEYQSIVIATSELQ